LSVTPGSYWRELRVTDLSDEKLIVSVASNVVERS